MIFFLMCILLTQQNKAKMIQGGGGKIISERKKNITCGGIEPVSPAWKASIQTTWPLNHC